MEAISSMSATTNTIDGTWINSDEEKKRTTKIIISNRGKNVQVIDEGGSKKYNWGTKVLTPETNSTNMYWAIFDTHKAKSTFIFIINNHKMEVRYEQDYKSPSMETKLFVENFTKLNLHAYESMVLSSPSEVMISSPTEFENLPKLHPDTTPIMLNDDSVTNHDFNSFHYCLPSTYHLKYKEEKNYGLRKWVLNMSTFIGFILNRIRHTVSIRKIISLTDMTI